MTQTDYQALTRELEHRRGAHRTELAERLRDARVYGSPGDDDVLLAVLEDVAVDQLRIDQLARLLDRATIVRAFRGADGIAAPRHRRPSARHHRPHRRIRARWPPQPRRDADPSLHGLAVGRALLGARRGDTVDVALPNGRTRALTVMHVRPADTIEHRRGQHVQAA
jgi:transcription elongation GreA/GreB family factor